MGKHIQELRLDIKIADIIIEYLCSQLVKWRHTKNKKEKELFECLASAKHQKKT